MKKWLSYFGKGGSTCLQFAFFPFLAWFRILFFFAIFVLSLAVFQFWKCPAVCSSTWKPVRFLCDVICIEFSILLIFPPFSELELTARPRGFDFSAFRFSPIFLAFYWILSGSLLIFGFWDQSTPLLPPDWPHMQDTCFLSVLAPMFFSIRPWCNLSTTI